MCSQKNKPIDLMSLEPIVLKVKIFEVFLMLNGVVTWQSHFRRYKSIVVQTKFVDTKA